MREIVRLLRRILDALTTQGGQKLAYNYRLAASMADVSVEKLRQHVERGELSPAYIDSKPVIMHEELERWLRSRPTDKPEKKSGCA